MMKRQWLAAILCVVFCVSQAAFAGDNSDPFVDLSLVEAVKGTQYERWNHQYTVYYLEGKLGAAILNNETERDLFLFAYRDGGWQTEAILKDAVCQGANSCCFVFSEDSDPAGGDLIITHHYAAYTLENFAFRHDGTQWVFDYAYFRTPTGEMGTDAIYTNPMNVAYVTWQDGKLVFDWYIDDMYGQIQGAQKIDMPMGNQWIKGDRESFTVTWPNQITLETFQLDAFPRDELTQATMLLPEYECGNKLGQTASANVGASGVEYAVVNNPNPEDRLNLREKPDKGSEYMGKYYNGMQVRVLEQTADGWARVFVGNNRTGYMRSEYLAFGEAGKGVANAMPTFTAPERAWNLLYAPFDASNVKMTMSGGETIEVMGVVSGWWHISCAGQTGFIRQLVDLE